MFANSVVAGIVADSFLRIRKDSKRLNHQVEAIRVPSFLVVGMKAFSQKAEYTLDGLAVRGLVDLKDLVVVGGLIVSFGHGRFSHPTR